MKKLLIITLLLASVALAGCGLKGEIMEYCSDGQSSEGLEMFTGEVLYEKGDYLVVSGYYQISDMGGEKCTNEGCMPMFRIYSSGYDERVFSKEFCVRKNPSGRRKDMIEQVENNEDPKEYTYSECKSRIRESGTVGQRGNESVIYYDPEFFTSK